MFYNTVLLPPPSVASHAYAIARAFFKAASDQYCLEEGKVFPHITLAQCFCEDAATIEGYAGSIQDIKPPPAIIHFNDVYFMPGAKDHEGYLWTGLSVARNNPALDALHRDVLDTMQRHGIEPLGKVGADYWPHLTFARLRGDAAPAFNLMGHSDLFSGNGHAGWKLAFGRSDRNGCFLG